MLRRRSGTTPYTSCCRCTNEHDTHSYLLLLTTGIIRIIRIGRILITRTIHIDLTSTTRTTRIARIRITRIIHIAHINIIRTTRIARTRTIRTTHTDRTNTDRTRTVRVPRSATRAMISITHAATRRVTTAWGVPPKPVARR